MNRISVLFSHAIIDPNHVFHLLHPPRLVALTCSSQSLLLCPPHCVAQDVICEASIANVPLNASSFANICSHMIAGGRPWSLHRLLSCVCVHSVCFCVCT